MSAKNKIILSILIFCLSYSVSSQDTAKVLFIGNSYTYYNDLPVLFLQLAASGGRKAIVDYSTQGGFTLENHFSYQQTLNKIIAEHWDFVVLQEQSQYPVIPYYRDNKFFVYGKKLDSLIKLNYQGTKTMLYMTWGRKYGGQQCINSYCSPVFTDYFHMQDSLASSYNALRTMISSEITPVGIAWKRALEINQNANLWDPDNSHPSLGGSYLAACMFYYFIFDTSPVGLPYYGGLSQEEANFYQSVSGSFIPIGIIKNENIIPASYKLYENYPNPFNPVTKIKFDIPKGNDEIVKLEIYDELGRQIETLVNEKLGFGSYEVSWNASNYSSGVYFYRLKSQGFTETKKLMLIK